MPKPSKPQTRKIKTGTLYRALSFDRAAVKEESRSLELSFSSETEQVERWFGIEILDHSPGAVRMGRLASGRAPFLKDHNPREQIGVIDTAEIGADRMGRAAVRFGKSDLAEQELIDARDGIRTNVSVGYLVHRYMLEKEGKGGEPDVYRAIDWEPVEISLVSIPADVEVGIGRAGETATDHETLIEHPTQKETRTMKCKHCQRELADGEFCSCPEARAEQTPPAKRSAPQVDEGALLQRERARVREIGAIASQFGKVAGVAELARQFTDNGQGVDAFRAAVMERMGQPKPASIPDPVDLGLSRQEDQQYSMLKALRCLISGNRSGYEFDLSQAIAKKLGRDTEGIFVPTALSVRAPMTTGTDGDGGHTVQTSLMPIIELLRNRMMTRQLGAQVLSGLTGDLKFPRQEKSATLVWAAENAGTDAADTDATAFFGQVGLTPKMAIATIPYSKQFLAQSSLDVENFLRNDLATANAIGLDLAGIAGTGTEQPTGILNTTGIGSVVCGDPDGAALDWADIVAFETEVAVDNADIGNLAYLTNAKVRGKLKTTEKASGTGLFVWEDGNEAGFGSLNGYRAAVSNQVSGALSKGVSSGILSAMIYGNWADLIYGEWGVVELLVDPYRLKKQGLIEITSQMLADVAVRHPQSFAASKDIIT